MSQPSLLPAPRLHAEVEDALLDLAEHKMLSPARRAHYELRLLGATVLPQRQVIAQTNYGKWLFVNHMDDPTARRGVIDAVRRKQPKVPVPPNEVARLRELEHVGVRPDLVWLGHQLPDTYEAGQVVPVPSPKHLREKDQRLKLGLKTGSEIWLRTATGVLAAALALPAVAAAGLLAGVGADPIVLGGVRHPEYPVVQWALLAQWEWE